MLLDFLRFLCTNSRQSKWMEKAFAFVEIIFLVVVAFRLTFRLKYYDWNWHYLFQVKLIFVCYNFYSVGKLQTSKIQVVKIKKNKLFFIFFPRLCHKLVSLPLQSCLLIHLWMQVLPDFQHPKNLVKFFLVRLTAGSRRPKQSSKTLKNLSKKSSSLKFYRYSCPQIFHFPCVVHFGQRFCALHSKRCCLDHLNTELVCVR